MKTAQSLAFLYQCFPASKITDAMSATYLEVCQNVSHEAVEVCCKDFRHGNVERGSHAFMPSTAEFTRHLKAVVADIRKHKAQQTRQIPPLDKGSVISLTDRLKMAEKVKYLADHGPDAAAKKYGIQSFQRKKKGSSQ